MLELYVERTLIASHCVPLTVQQRAVTTYQPTPNTFITTCTPMIILIGNRKYVTLGTVEKVLHSVSTILPPPQLPTGESSRLMMQ